jgi:hypothetical protein
LKVVSLYIEKNVFIAELSIKEKTVFCMCIEMGVRKMKAKKLISLLVAMGFVVALTVCPAFAESQDAYVAPSKDHNLITGTLDYLGSLVEVSSGLAWDTFESGTDVIPRCCGERIRYRPNIIMNRGSRWSRVYRR